MIGTFIFSLDRLSSLCCKWSDRIILFWSGIEMQDNKCGDKLAAALKGRKIDILINNAGYFYEPVEKVDSLNFEEVHCSLYPPSKKFLNAPHFFFQFSYVLLFYHYPISLSIVAINSVFWTTCDSPPFFTLILSFSDMVNSLLYSSGLSLIYRSWRWSIFVP